MEDWYNISFKQLIDVGGAGLLGVHKGVVKKALRTAFPEYAWDDSKFPQKLPQGHWNDVNNQRAFFEQYAKEHSIFIMV
jgi:hypothetical protein